MENLKNLVPSIKAQHKASRLNLIESTASLSKEEIIKKWLIELNAKNKAYFFIIESGLLEEFREYCMKGGAR